MKVLIFGALGVLLGIFAFVWLVSRVRYRIGSRHMKVFVLGVRLRRISLDSIESISKRAGDGWVERWWSTFHPKHRMLILRRRRGLFRNVAITPRNRYVFKSELQRAIQRQGKSSTQEPSEIDETEAPNLQDSSQLDKDEG